MNGTTKLRKEIRTPKFGLVFPADTELKCIADEHEEVQVYHPRYTSICVRVSPMKIYDTIWDQTDWKK